MRIPIVKFSSVPTVLEMDCIYGFLFDNDWGWGRYILKRHPRLKPVLGLKKKADRMAFIRAYVLEYRRKKKERIMRQKALYVSIWKKKERAAFEQLSKVMGTDWPKKRKSIRALISINPICPRFLDTWSFFIFFNYRNPSHAVETILHEACHFLYFKKWKEVFPAAKRRTFESPHIEWHLSELLAPIILNGPELRPFLKKKAAFYEEHEAVKIKGVSAPVYFTKLYERRESFESFLKESYREIKKYKKRFAF